MPIKLFISYSHDSEDHAKKVLQLANDLRRAGFDVPIDQHVAAPEEGWPLWMENGIEDSAFVLLICTETYKRRITGKEKEKIGYGCRFEGKVIYNAINKDASRNNKFLPVLLNIDDKAHIPLILDGDTFYLISSDDPCGFDDLERRLHGKHKAFTPHVGKTKEIISLQDPGSYFNKTINVELQIDLPVTPGDIVGREKEVEQLNQAWDDENTRIISFIAWGGVGKSSLINTWRNDMRDNGYKGAERVFAHSFYSQGTSDQRHVSAEHFINMAFRFLRFTGERPSSPHEQGLLLADLFSQRKTLLILDGLEPMQYPPGDLQGRLKDQSLSALLKNLAYKLNGLCVITSRVPVFELQATRSLIVELERLSVEAGIQVLENNKVTGPKAEMVKAVEEVEGHALTLALLGSYLKTVYKGDIRKRDQMPAYTGRNKQGRHAKKVMASYHGWLKTQEGPELDILHILGLFDRVVTKDAIDVLKAAPAIEGVSERIQELSLEDWAFAVESLAELNLILQPDETQALDCHPLVREYFTEQLKDQNPEGYKSAHTRLYEYYKNLPEKELPDTLEELEPLFTAVAHGCLAGLHQTALDEVYWPKIQREDENYIIRKLGAYGIDLACVACFFDKTWDMPAAGLIDADKAAALNWAGFRLRGLGRLLEAVELFVASVEIPKLQEDWISAASAASNTSELYLVLGNLAQAIAHGEQSDTYADRSEDEFQKIARRTTWANALFQSGEQKKAKALFMDAEAIQQKDQPEYDTLYAQRGFQFCSLLLDLGEVGKVIERAEKSKILVERNNLLMETALDQLTLGKAHFQKRLKQNPAEFDQAKTYLNQAVAGLRDAGGLDDLPLGLLARATFQTHQNNHKSAWQDLDEVFESATYSQMLLHLSDYHLEACRNIHQQLKTSDDNFVIKENGQELAPNSAAMKTRFAHHLEQAEKLIEQTGYHRRDGELVEVQQLPDLS
ncbi:MAG: TIR and AAA domain-containing protein [Algicola sp.]|nr:TIR and AAA domain-containing protein [Algicola sp.]